MGVPGLDSVTKYKLDEHGVLALNASEWLTDVELAHARFEMRLKERTEEMTMGWSRISIVNNKFGLTRSALPTRSASRRRNL